jgi:hypothetical protein
MIHLEAHPDSRVLVLRDLSIVRLWRSFSMIPRC